MAKVTLDMETFKALASSTRLQVLRALDERRKTLSELAKELELNKATIHEHLGILDATGLVKKKDEGRKWIYYELTWAGERLLHPQETTTFAVLLGISVAAAGGGVAMLGAAMNWWWAENRLQGGTADDAGEFDAAPSDEQSETAADSPEGAGDSDTDDSSMGDSEGRGAGDADSAADKSEPGMEFFSSDDPDGIFALLLFATAVLLAVLAFVVRRSRRASA